MNKTTAILSLSLAVVGLGGAMPTFAVDSLRGAAIEAMSTPPAKRKVDVVEGGIERTFEQQPPLIPHKIENYRLNLRQNGCMRCHSKAAAEKENTKPPSANHFVDRDGKELAKLSSRRYFCTQCHMVQIKGEPLVENSFQGLK
ncbi:nitrate reductase cytochrome c-type subunit [Candidatus Thiosymbion oneisti]|uniref:nitrate reductase cytochrome c-type subunit n=1 Tax=Candidatus Thiosymbion oneisti TaxID=589554 RepID=UPI001060F0F1|nr:nitrate reductase cytochrome c-type subunit [Candidatus Thiosymbion oneisti]